MKITIQTFFYFCKLNPSIKTDGNVQLINLLANHLIT
jgi:hypothetical protein